MMLTEHVYVDERTGTKAIYLSMPSPGAWANGSRVRKRKDEPGDAHPIGALGTIRSSIPVLEDARAEMPDTELALTSTHFYWVMWDDDSPQMPVGLLSAKLELITEAGPAR